MNTNYTTTKSQTIADIGIGILATIFLFTCWGHEGWLFNLALIWGGMCAGYIVTIYLNEGEDE
jgi:glycerol uptake facilitator-like aquaporin